jgi:carbon monoxide dehydrogenase subunit G
MTTIERTMTVNKPVEVVQAYLKDFSNTEQWDPGTKRTTQETPGEIGVGTTWHNVSEFRGKETELTYTLTVAEPAHLVFQGENKTVTATDDIKLTADGYGTRIDYTATFDFHGLAVLAVPFIKGQLNDLGDETQQQMVRVINAL